MGKCVSRQSSAAQHHQSVLTIALSQQDLAQAHKIWQQLTASNEYIDATASTDEPPFYYHISDTSPKASEEAATAAVLHIESVYNHLDAHVDANVNVDDIIGSSLTVNNNNNNSSSNRNESIECNAFATCQDFLLQELAQTLLQREEYHQLKTITPESNCSGFNTEAAAAAATASSFASPSLSDSVSDNDSNDEQQHMHEKQQQQHQRFQILLKKGQTESKKHGGKANRRHNGNGPTHELTEEQLHTKGTAMSFGFRKKLNGTPKKFKKLLEGGTVGSGKAQTDIKDDNGNAAPPVQFEKVGVAASKTTTTTTNAANNRTGAAGKRFGYRGAVPRPASTSLTTPTTAANTTSDDSEESAANAQNNNYSNNNNAGTTNGQGLVSNLKRRSKSAHTGRTIDGETKIAQPKQLTFNLNQNTTIEYQRRQFFGEIADEANAAAATAATGVSRPRYNYNNLANMHANVIVRPTPRAAPPSFAKFTLQTVSLPRPEYPVAISLTATTPTTPSSSVQSPVPAHNTGARAKEIPTTTSRSHPLTSIHVQPTRQLDQKSVKQITNNSTRRGFSGSREISADSGIASMDMAVDSGSSSGGSASSSKRSRSRPRNLQMVMSGRHTFEVRDVDDPPSSESNSFVETLALPKLPTDNSQTAQLPLLGLVRSNTVLSRESYERRQATGGQNQETPETPPKPSGSDDSESVDEEKLYLDSSTSEKSGKQQSQSSSMSWRCLAGESLAAKDCSSMSISDTQEATKVEDKEEDMSLGMDDMSLINTEMQFSTMSSMTEPKPSNSSSYIANESDNLLNMHIVDNREAIVVRLPLERPRSFNNALNESKFAELALANSGCLLLDDETSPTDSLVSSTDEMESEEAGGKLKKHKLNAELQQKDNIDVDIDDISPLLELELDLGSHSPHSPGTPTHASHSLSLGSDCGNLIDDEIADQPALLCNSEAPDVATTDTPTLMETHTQTGSLRSLKSQSKARTALQQAIELSLRTPAAVRRAVLESAESLDTLSPCESICSDDLMMDFDLNSSVDSIDRTLSVRSRSGSDLHKLGADLEADQAETEAELLAQLECKGSDVMKELNSLLRVRMQRSAPSPRERISAKLPARATRLLNRSRLQDQAGNESDNSLRSTHSGASSGRKRSTAASRASTASSTSSLQRRNQQQQQQQQLQSSTSSALRRSTGQRGQGGSNAELHSSSDDLMLYDKSFRNAMIQDVLQFKKQLLRLRRILQEEADFDTKRTETLNPFENDNMQLFAACGLDSKQLNDIDLASLTSSTTEDPLQELSDLRRQVVYLQGQVDDRDRTIRLQRDLIEQLEAEKRQSMPADASVSLANKECISMATQTERTRPLAIGAEGLSRSKPEYTSYTTHFPTLHLHCNDSTVAATTIIRHQQQPQQPCNGNHNNNNSNSNNHINSNNNNCRALSQTRRHTIISTTLTNYNQQLAAAAYPRRASIGWEAAADAVKPTTAAPAVHKPVRITLIGEALPLAQQNGVKARFMNGGCQSNSSNGSSKAGGLSVGSHHHYQPLYNSNKMTNPTVTIV